MNQNQAVNLELEANQQQELESLVLAWAKSCQGDTIKLLGLLRILEELHRQIREGVFRKSLPDNRQHLYHLLRDIEESGGWPYIQRLKIRNLLVNLEEEDKANES